MKNDNKSKTENVEREPAKLDLELTHKSETLIPVPTDVISKFIKYAAEKCSQKSNCSYQYTKMADSNVVSIFTNGKKSGEEILDDINKCIVYEFGDFIEQNTGIARKKFYRTLTLFESTVENFRITLQWPL